MSSPRLQTAIPGCSLASLSGLAATPIAIESPGLMLLQLNFEGLTTAKLNIVEPIVRKSDVTIVLLQETHTDNKKFLKLPGFSLTAHNANKHHGIATMSKLISLGEP